MRRLRGRCQPTRSSPYKHVASAPDPRAERNCLIATARTASCLSRLPGPLLTGTLGRRGMVSGLLGAGRRTSDAPAEGAGRTARLRLRGVRERRHGTDERVLVPLGETRRELLGNLAAGGCPLRP